MLKVRKENIVILGVDAENVKRLQSGQPIQVKGSDLGIDIDIYVVYGEPLETLYEQLGIPRQH